MQSRAARITVAIVAIAAVVVLFVVLRDDGGGDEPAETSPAAESEVPAGTPLEPDAKPKPEPEPKPAVATTKIRVEGGEPVGGAKEISLERGERGRIEVTTPDTTDHVHLHGYDLFADLAPRKPAKIDFKATIEGVFEVELEDRVVPLAEVTVNP